MASDCQACPSKVYNYTNSTTYQKANYSKTEVNIGYEDLSLTLTGFAAQDGMCVVPLSQRPSNFSINESDRNESTCLQSF